MQYVTACILLLTLCGPVFIKSKKVMLLIPSQIRRSPIGRAPIGYPKHPFYDGIKYRPYDQRSPNLYGKPKPHFDKSKLPQGGDDFDQGYESVRHLMIPHGTGISHGLSFGRGYIPYDKFKGDFIRFHDYPRTPENIPEASYQHSSLTVSPAIGPDYSKPPPQYVSPDPYSSERKEEYEPLYDRGKLSLRSINNIGNSVNTAIRNINNDDTHSKGTPVISEGASVTNTRKQGIVISDSVILDDYNKKVEEFTKSWPKIAGFVAVPTSVPFASQFATSGNTVLQLSPQIAQGRQGYAVREEIQEPTPDFRNIISTPLQRGQKTKNIGVSSFISVQG